ncbi:hypothetical protein CHLRE_13g571950v5 [Chlamydomonas reinhardtii]|uniref:Caffeoyl-CoA O-methyltransferase n=1 Tax=Chlamydomonas reinhardtii TaxID=3055 RepID=A0A2K3CZQ0_CHLRE|nr:uncharacterized protein CHLRE_13g571950v5 [Chlamydomonas reinhardtii]PNW73770.1 hypothetical protein CHLRE_13g571950v5 [Chlamydomonas reinhardtii]
MHAMYPGSPRRSCVEVRRNCSGRVRAASEVSPGKAASTGGRVINKVPVAIGMTPQVYDYMLEHTREPEVLRRLREETADVHGSHMQITPEQGALLGLLVELVGAKRVVEVGVFTGYSSTAMALALPADGKLVALDRDERPVAMAQRYWGLAGVEERVELRVGPAEESLQALLERDGPGSYDMAFIDADKRAYDSYYELLLQLVRPGGLIAIDNVLFYGKVADPPPGDKAALALRDLNAKLLADTRISVSMVPIGDGMTLCRRR